MDGVTAGFESVLILDFVVEEARVLETVPIRPFTTLLELLTTLMVEVAATAGTASPACIAGTHPTSSSLCMQIIPNSQNWVIHRPPVQVRKARVSLEYKFPVPQRRWPSMQGEWVGVADIVDAVREEALELLGFPFFA